MAIIIGFSYWQLNEFSEIESEADEYHLSTVLNCVLIKEEVINMQYHAYKILAMDELSGIPTYSDHFRPNISIFLAKERMDIIKELQRRYNHQKYASTLNNADHLLSQLLVSKEAGGFIPSMILHKTSKELNQFVIFIDQLQRLHSNAHDELMAGLLLKREQAFWNILIFLFVSGIMGVLLANKILNLIRSSESELDKHRRHLLEMVKKRTKELFDTNEDLRKEITERRRLEKEILEIDENERRRIGHDLHDNLGQQLTGISFKSQNLEKRLKEKQIPEAEIAAKIISLIDKARDDMEHTSKGLSPIFEKGRENLIAALEQLSLNIEKLFDIPCVMKCAENITINNKAAVINLYRIAQEAATNAAKHSGTQNIEISLYARNNIIIMTIKDEGIGIPKAGDITDGMGLKIMDYRASMIGASLDIRPNVNGGTLVKCIYIDAGESITNKAENDNA